MIDPFEPPDEKMHISKDIDIENRFSKELNDIRNKLTQLKNGRVYEISRATMDGYLATNIEQLEKMIDELINKIEYGKKSFSEEIKPYL